MLSFITIVAPLIKHTADLKKLVESDDIVLCAVLSLVDDRDEILHGGKPVGIVDKASVEACGIYYGADLRNVHKIDKRIVVKILVKRNDSAV